MGWSGMTIIKHDGPKHLRNTISIMAAMKFIDWQYPT